MNSNTVIFVATIIGTVFALPGAVLSILLLKDRWNHGTSNNSHYEKNQI